MNLALEVELDENYTDIICHHTGSTSLRFANRLRTIVRDVTKMELIAYDIPSRMETIDASNDTLDFELGPFIMQVALTDGGLGYDKWNLPNLHVTSYRSTLTSSDGGFGVAGVRILHSNGTISPTNVQASAAGIANVPTFVQDNLALSFEISDEGTLTNPYVVRTGSTVHAQDAQILIDPPFEYPYSVHVCHGASFSETGNRCFTDVVQLGRAFALTNDMNVLAMEITKEINFSLGWTVHGPTATYKSMYYDSATSSMQPSPTFAGDDARWTAGEAGRHLLFTGTWPSSAPRYQCRYDPQFGFVFVDWSNESFTLGDHSINTGGGTIAHQTKKLYEYNRVNFGKDGLGNNLLLSKYTPGGGRLACVTTMWGILGFAHVSGVVQSQSKAVQFRDDNGAFISRQGYASQIDVLSQLNHYYQMYLTRRRATATVSTLKCSARLRHGIYSIGNVLHQPYRLPGLNANETSQEISIRQAADGLLKEVQDQMNIAYMGHTIAVPVGDPHIPSTFQQYAKLSLPRFDSATSSPHFFVVSLEDADTYNGQEAQSATNLQCNQNRKNRIRISFAEQRFRYLGATIDAQRESRLKLKILAGTGPNKHRSVANILGFETKDVPDSEFVQYVPLDNAADPPANANYASGTDPLCTYGVQAASVYDLQVRSKLCRIMAAFNNRSYSPLAIAAVSGRTDHAAITTNTDGSMHSYAVETTKLSGSTKVSQLHADQSKLLLYPDARTAPVVSPMLRTPMVDNLNVPLFRGMDWGSRQISLDQRADVREVAFELRDGKTENVWKCHASENCSILLRLHHPTESRFQTRL